MKIAVILLISLLLTSCRSGDLMTVYSEGETSGADTTDVQGSEQELPVGTLTLIEMTETVSAGKKASVTVRGLPNTEYSITVIYSTSVSQASGLSEKTTDENGLVSWSWRVGNQTKPGRYEIIIQCQSEKINLFFNVDPPESTK